MKEGCGQHNNTDTGTSHSQQGALTQPTQGQARCPLRPLSGSPVVSLGVAGQETDAGIPWLRRKPHPGKQSAGPRGTELLLQDLDELVVEEEQLPMGQEA